MRWLGLVLGVAFGAAAVFYLIVGFVPDSGVARGMRARLELAAEVGRARRFGINSAAVYAWLLRSKPRTAVVVIFLSFWAVWFVAAALHA